MKRMFCIAGLLLVWLPPASADEFPHYDVAAFCHINLEKAGAWSAALCSDNQYSARRRSVQRWSLVSPAVQNECTAASFGSYMTLDVCLESYVPH